VNAPLTGRRIGPKEAFSEISPNSKIDTLIDDLITEAKDRQKCPIDVAIKLVAQAVAWEKVKHHIRDQDQDFNPDDL
jgi:hypothetical protein